MKAYVWMDKTTGDIASVSHKRPGGVYKTKGAAKAACSTGGRYHLNKDKLVLCYIESELFVEETGEKFDNAPS